MLGNLPGVGITEEDWIPSPSMTRQHGKKRNGEKQRVREGKIEREKIMRACKWKNNEKS